MGSPCGVLHRSIEEDEYCLIPMGGVLPRVPQRVLGIGGTAGMVHPSTGAPGHLSRAAPKFCHGRHLMLSTDSLGAGRRMQKPSTSMLSFMKLPASVSETAHSWQAAV